MKRSKELKEETEEKFKRKSGVSKKNFEEIVRRVVEKIKEEKEANNRKKRGRKDSKLSEEDRVLIVLYYLRHYVTFINLGDDFGIKESYCQKIYTKYTKIMSAVIRLPSRKEMLNNPREILALDVSEQPIERPVKKQKKYYSGKKKDIR